MQREACEMQREACEMQHEACEMQRETCDMQHGLRCLTRPVTPTYDVSTEPASTKNASTETLRCTRPSKQTHRLRRSACAAFASWCHAPLSGIRAKAAASLQHATCSMQHATCSMRHATCDMQHATCNMQHATCRRRGATDAVTRNHPERAAVALASALGCADQM
jgi:hypothetical protein